MRIIKCLIVDDEPVAREILERFCSYIPYVSIEALCSNALEAKAKLAESSIDLLFLDIDFPVLDGISFLRTLRNPPQIILTTGYSQYAVEAFELEVCDYLLKPFLLDRFIIAVDKAKRNIEQKEASVVGNNDNPDDTPIFIRKDGKFLLVKADEVYYAEAFGNYSKLIGKNGEIVSNMSFGSLEKILPPPNFVRVHRSFIINRSFILQIENGSVLLSGRHEIPIGNNYRESFFRFLGLQ